MDGLLFRNCFLRTCEVSKYLIMKSSEYFKYGKYYKYLSGTPPHFVRCGLQLLT